MESLPGHKYSIHGYGLPIILTPALALAERLAPAINYLSDDLPTYVGLASDRDPMRHSSKVAYEVTVGGMLSIILVGSFLLLASAVMKGGADVSGRVDAVPKSVMTWILFAFFIVDPILIFSKFLSVEIIAFLFVSYGVWVVSRQRLDKHIVYILPVASGLLEFVHVKFIVLSGGVLLTVLIIYWGRLSRRDIAVASVLFVIPIVFLSLLNHQLYGSYSLNAQYESGALSLTYIVQGTLGIFLDANTGLLFASPVYCLLFMAAIQKNSGNIELRNGLLLLLLVGVPLILLSSLHVLNQQAVSYKLNYDFVKALFLNTNKVPMWYQTPVSRFIFPLVPIFVYIIVLGAMRLVAKKRWRLIVSVLIGISLLISWWQVLLIPHSLFRPNADFESYAPFWSLVLGYYAFVVPNFLTFRYPLENIVLGISWLSIILMLLFSAQRRYYWGTVFGLICIVTFAFSMSRIKPYGDIVQISPVQMRSNMKTIIRDDSRLIRTRQPVSTDLLYGPYVYLPAGHYCMHLSASVKATYSQFKWYIADAFTGKVYIMEETFTPLKSSDFNPTMCFQNKTPDYPKEVKVYGKEFLGSLTLFGIVFQRKD